MEFGLKKQEDLENEIHRYPAFHVNTLIRDIEKELQSNPNSGMYIISSIPFHDCYKLPNFCISSMEDLEEFKASLDNNFFDKFLEVWYCKKPFQNGHDVITGRIALDNRKGLNDIQYSHTVEQVWNCSHREIEKFNKNSNTIYLRAFREGWGRRYHIDALRVPSEKKADKDKLIKSFIQTVRGIESNKEKIEEGIQYYNTHASKKINKLEDVLENSKEHYQRLIERLTFMKPEAKRLCMENDEKLEAI